MDVRSYHFFVEGKPKGKERPRHGAYGNTYTPKETKDYERFVAQSFIEANPVYSPFNETEPVEVVVIAFYKPPKKYDTKPKREMIKNNELLPLVKPDVDNVAKAIMDSLNGLVYCDDKQISSLIISKQYCDKEGVLVTVRSYQPNKKKWLTRGRIETQAIVNLFHKINSLGIDKLPF